MSANLENSAVATVFIPIPKKGNAEECSNYCTIALISHTSKVLLKLQDRLQQYMNSEFALAGFSKGRGTRDPIANICWIIEKVREFQKNIYFCFINSAEAFDYVDHNKLRAIGLLIAAIMGIIGITTSAAVAETALYQMVQTTSFMQEWHKNASSAWGA